MVQSESLYPEEKPKSNPPEWKNFPKIHTILFAAVPAIKKAPSGTALKQEITLDLSANHSNGSRVISCSCWVPSFT